MAYSTKTTLTLSILGFVLLYTTCSYTQQLIIQVTTYEVRTYLKSTSIPALTRVSSTKDFSVML